jgi:hypothetical protein
MSIANPENYRFGYFYAGGRPPASLEVLLVDRDKVARYVAGHPWPKQPPYDEVGIYQRKLGDQEWCSLEDAIVAAHPEGARIGDAPRTMDAGLESLFAPTDEGLWRATWNPSEPPTVLARLMRMVRSMISELRAHPLCTLQISLEYMPSNSQIYLRLFNKGKAPFEFTGFGKTSKGNGEIRVQFVADEERGQSPHQSPIQLLRLSPISVDQLDGVAVGEMLIEPGQTVLLALKESGSILRQLRRGGVFHALIHIFWKAPGFPIESELEEGWLMPEPLEVKST